MASGKEHKKLDKTIDPKNVLEGVKWVVSKLRPDWNKNKINYKVFTDGISNQLIGCFYIDEPGILVRIYGVGTELFIDRDAEKRTMALLSEAGLCADLIASFNNGIVYYYVPGEVLNVDSVRSPSVWPLVARKLGAMHRIPVTGESQLWKQLANFLKLLPDTFDGNGGFKDFVRLFPTKESLHNEVKWLKGKLGVSTSPVVFAHNDLLLTNIILNKDKSDVTFIDFEYGSPNYQAYEIANHFNEYAGVENADYSKLPSLSYKRKWIHEYLQSWTGQPPSPNQVESMLLQTEQFMGASHVFWGLWSLIQAIHSKIDFEFHKYACMRFKKYMEIRSKIQ